MTGGQNMFTRVVRFTGVSRERLDQFLARVRDSGAPEGVRSSGISFLYDESQQTVVVLQRFGTAEDMEESARILSAMDSGDTPGTRASVDACEVALELNGH
jgi:hypothetical protein